MNRSLRSFAVALLALLVLGAQCEGMRHALAHRAAALTAPHEQSLQVPNDSPCIECRLLAGSSNLIVGGATAAVVAFVAPWPSFWLPHPALASAPAYYRSRAPPSLH